MRLAAKVLVVWTILVCSTVFAEGFSVQGVFRANLNGSLIIQGEGGYSDTVLPGLEVGGRLALDLNPVGDSTSILLYGFAEYRKTLLEQTVYEENDVATQAFARGELGVGYLFSDERNTFFPRAVLSMGLEGSSPFSVSMKTFGQLKASFEFIPTDRAKLGSSQRIGFIIIPFVPYVASESYYNFVDESVDFYAYVGSLLYFSEQIFIGVDLGVNNNTGYARVFANFTER
jgi:hypothetical protein